MKCLKNKTLQTCSVLLGMVFLCLLIYSNSVDSPFTFDDSPFILKDHHVHVDSLSLNNLKDAWVNGRPKERPLSNLTFALNYYLGQDDPFGYHLANISIHLFSGIFLYFLIFYSLGVSNSAKYIAGFSKSFSDNNRNNDQWLAFAGTCIWLAYPIHTQSVTYICQRMTSLAAMFYVASLVFYVRGRMAMTGSIQNRNGYLLWFFGAVFFGGCAVASKPNAAMLPIMIAAYEGLFFHKIEKSRFNRRILWLMGLLILCGFAVVYYLGPDPISRIFSGYQSRDFTLPQRLMTQFRVVIYYISLIIFPDPARLNLDYDYPLSFSLLSPPTTIIALAAIVCLIVTALYLVKKDPLLSFAIIWFLGNLIIESSVIGLEMVFEHRTYIPSMLLVSIFSIKMIKRLRARPLQIISVCACLLVLGVFTYQRNRIWQDEARLWADCAVKSPEKSRPHYNLGCILVKRNLYDETINQFAKAAQIDPGSADTQYNLGFAMAQKKLYRQSIVYFQKALALDPGNADAHTNLANALSRIGENDSALVHYRQAVKLKPNDTDFQVNLAMELFGLRKYDEAISCYQKALSIKPNSPDLLNKIGYVYFLSGDIDAAKSCYLKAVHLAPDDPETHGKIGDALLQEGDIQSAISHYLKAIQLNPKDAQSRYNLGIAYLKTGQRDLATIQFEAANQLDPELKIPEFSKPEVPAP